MNHCFSDSISMLSNYSVCLCSLLSRSVRVSLELMPGERRFSAGAAPWVCGKLVWCQCSTFSAPPWGFDSALDSATHPRKGAAGRTSHTECIQASTCPTCCRTSARGRPLATGNTACPLPSSPCQKCSQAFLKYRNHQFWSRCSSSAGCFLVSDLGVGCFSSECGRAREPAGRTSRGSAAMIAACRCSWPPWFSFVGHRFGRIRSRCIDVSCMRKTRSIW